MDISTSLQIGIKMQDTRKWISSKYILPKNNQKIYYFSYEYGMFLGQYFYKKDRPSGCVSSHIFTNDHVTLGEKQVSYWMPYDHALRDMIPLPPDYMIDMNNSQSIINTGEEVLIPEEEREFSFTFIQTKGG